PGLSLHLPTPALLPSFSRSVLAPSTLNDHSPGILDRAARVSGRSYLMARRSRNLLCLLAATAILITGAGLRSREWAAEAPSPTPTTPGTRSPDPRARHTGTRDPCSRLACTALRRPEARRRDAGA